MTFLATPQRIPVLAVIQCAMDIEAAPFVRLLTDVSMPLVIGGGSKLADSDELEGKQSSADLEVSAGKTGLAQDVTPSSPQNEDLLNKPALASNDTATDQADSLAEKKTENGRQTFTLGMWNGHSVLIVTSGIGLVNSASATARALTLVRPQVVIAAGTAGGLAASVNVGDVVISTSAVFNAADATAFGYARGQIPGMPPIYEVSPAISATAQQVPGRVSHRVLFGQAISGDAFVTATNVGSMRDDFPDALTTDMETAALAQVAWSSGVDWAMIRAVSDLCGPAANQDFHMDAAKAAEHSCDAVEAFLRLMP